MTRHAKGTAYLHANDSAGNLRIYIIETPKDSPRPSLGLAVSCALSRLWYYCGHFCGRYEWKVFLVEYLGVGLLANVR